MRRLVSILLSLCLGLFLADAVVSLADDTLIVLFGVHLISVTRELLAFLALVVALLVYGLMGLTPMIPKRLFLPVTLFYPVALLALVPFSIYHPGRFHQAVWVSSLCQLLVGLGILSWVLGGFRLRWPLVAEERLGARPFSWLNLSGFLLANVFVLTPAMLLYLAVCASAAVDHFSEGFLALRPQGVTVEARKYVRNDGKTIRLVPMAHIGEPDFYQKLSRSFPSNSIILMEGVTDRRGLLTNELSYRRMASNLGLAEQEEKFEPQQGEMVHADVDVEEFTANTIGFLNLTMRLHSKGLDAGTLIALMECSASPGIEEQLLEDLLRRRNRHLLEQIHARLGQTEIVIVPWGAAHMPEIAREIQKSGFRLEESQDYEVIRFRSARK